MKRFIPLALIVLFAMSALFVQSSAATSDPLSQPEVAKSKPVVVYYFHTNRRCKTCLAIERISRNVVKDSFEDSKRVSFRSVNIEKEKNADLVERFEISGSSLVVGYGKKSTDLTTKAFMYAGTSPGKLQNVLIKTIKKYLK